MKFVPAARVVLMGCMMFPMGVLGETGLRGSATSNADVPTQSSSVATPPKVHISTGGGFDLGVNATFDVDMDEDFTPEEQMFIKYSVRRAYNAVHNMNTVVMQFTDMTSEERTPLVAAPAAAKSAFAAGAPVQAPSRQDLKRVRTPFNVGLGFTTVGNCRLCRSSSTAVSTSVSTLLTKSLEDSRASWALAMCNELQQGSFETLQSATNCTIDYFLPDTGINDGVEEAQLGITAHFTMPLGRDVTTNEQHFANECLRLSYNEVHDPATVFMETATGTNQAYYAVDGSSTDYSWTLDFTSQAWFRNVQSGDDDNGARRNSNLGSTKLISSSILKVNEVLQQQHIQWQEKFCEKLQTGPFEPFQSASNCLIQVNTNNNAAATLYLAGVVVNK